MTHPYNECSSTSIGIVKNLNSKDKDQVGLLIICLFSLLGLGYMYFNPIFLHSNVSESNTSFQKRFSAASLNTEKTATHLMNASNSATLVEAFNASSLAADATN